jgi:sugar phosphate isomerase/epimerase
MIRLSAFADEISPDLDEQIAVLHEEAIHLVELRSVWDTNVLDLTDDQVARIMDRFGEEDISVSVIGSPLGKVPVDVPLADELRRLERAIGLARRFGTTMIRIFSFYPPSDALNQEPTAYRDAVMERLSRMAGLAEGSGVMLVHENDTGLYGDTVERCLDVLQTVRSSSLEAAFDPANFIVSGEVPYPDAYDALSPWLAHVHVKDARPDRTVVAAGEGDARWPDLLDRMRSDAYDGIFSLEPHLRAAGRYRGFSGPDLFRYASQAFQNLLRRMDWEYG